VPRGRKKRIPQLKYTDTRGIGWHCSYRDPETDTPRKKRFGMIPEDEARALYHEWVAKHLRGERQNDEKPKPASSMKYRRNAKRVNAKVSPGSLAHVASGLMEYWEKRTREPGKRRARGTIDLRECQARKKYLYDFLDYLNKEYGRGAVGRMNLRDLEMEDVEGYNLQIVAAEYSDSQVNKRLQAIKALIDRAGRKEYGHQHLEWNWDSRDVVHGKPSDGRKLPSLPQLKKILKACDEQRQLMVWMGIGLGFGQSDLAAVEVGSIAEQGYDLRR